MSHDDDPDFVEAARFWSTQYKPITNDELIFRHSGWVHRRGMVATVLAKQGFPAARLERFLNCGCEAVIERSPSREKARVRAAFCHDRFCLPCAQARAALVRANLVRMIQGKSVKFLTLTLRPSDGELGPQIRRAIKCFRRLRETGDWRRRVQGGVWFLEVKMGSGSGKWHVHLHALVESLYFPQNELSALWESVTGDSFIVDVRKVNDAQHGASYVAKYATKGFDSTVFLSLDTLGECMRSLGGVRVFSQFGAWKGWGLEDRPSDTADWVRVASLGDTIAAARSGSPWAIALLSAIKGRLIVGPVDDDDSGNSESPPWLKG